MRATVLSVLLCLLSALVEVHSQTVPYISFMGTNLPNHSYVDLTLVGNADSGSDSVQCHTDLDKCCSGAQGAHRGDWHAPGSRDRLPYFYSFDSDLEADIYEQRRAQRVDLRRRNNGDTSGLYRCTIETNVVNGRETVYVGLYASGGDVTIPDGMTFTVDSDLYGEHPQFTLTCVSTGGPATTVTWTRDSEVVTGGVTVLDDPVTAQYTHTLTVTERLGEQYKCIVSNNKPSIATAQVIVEALRNLTYQIVDDGIYAAKYDEYIKIELFWSPVLLGTNAFRRISYYTLQDHLIFQSSEELPGSTTSTTVVVRDPHLGLQHIFTVRNIVKTQSTTYEGLRANISIVFDKAYFQLQFGSVDHCITWTSEQAEAIERKLQFEIKEAIFKNCSICRQFSNSFLRRGVFICQSSPTMATYRSTLFNTGIPELTNASSLVSYVQDWVATGPVVRLDWLLVRVNQECPVAIHQLSDPECPAPHSLQPELVNHINGVMNTCAVRSLGSQICQV